MIVVKRLKSDKMHELVLTNFIYKKRLADNEYHYYQSHCKLASESDLAMWLMKELNIEITNFGGYSIANCWRAYTHYSSKHNNEEQAIFACAEMILEGME